MLKNLLFFFSVLFFMGCKEQKPFIDEEVTAPQTFSIQDFPEIIDIHQEAKSILESWPEYMAMENSFGVLKRATNTEDLKLAIDDLMEKEKELAKANYPTDFDKLQIKSRQQLFRTFLFKVKANLTDNREVNEGMEQLIGAYNNFRNQFNILSSTTLDPKLILGEE